MTCWGAHGSHLWQGYRWVAGWLTDLERYYAWAGALMLRHRGPRVDRPGRMEPRELAGVRAWTDW